MIAYYFLFIGSSQLEYNHEIAASNVSTNKGEGWNIQHGPCDNSSQFQVLQILELIKLVSLLLKTMIFF